MAQQQLPSEERFKAFASKLQQFRGTLAKEDQHMFDAMVQAAFKHESKDDVQGYWWVAYPGYPGWYGAPVYYGTPWATYYGYGYPYYY